MHRVSIVAPGQRPDGTLVPCRERRSPAPPGLRGRYDVSAGRPPAPVEEPPDADPGVEEPPTPEEPPVRQPPGETDPPVRPPPGEEDPPVRPPPDRDRERSARH